MSSNSERTAALLLCLLLMASAHAQVTTLDPGADDWEKQYGASTGVISRLTAADTSLTDGKNNVIYGWSAQLDDYGREGRKAQPRSAEDIYGRISGAEREAAPLPGKGTTVPRIWTDGPERMDLYMLTGYGITYYLTKKPPVFYHVPTDDEIRWIRYYAVDRRKYTKTLFRRFSVWENAIRGYFESIGVPPEISVLCLVESGCTYGAVSPAGAVGMWQFMPATARQYGLAVVRGYDERKDPASSTLAAGRLLMDSYGQLGDWTLAVASYNCGVGGIRKRQAVSKRKDWEGIKPYLAKETRNYIPALIALYYVWTYREELGFTQNT